MPALPFLEPLMDATEFFTYVLEAYDVPDCNSTPDTAPAISLRHICETLVERGILVVKESLNNGDDTEAVYLGSSPMAKTYQRQLIGVLLYMTENNPYIVTKTARKRKTRLPVLLSLIDRQDGTINFGRQVVSFVESVGVSLSGGNIPSQSKGTCHAFITKLKECQRSKIGYSTVCEGFHLGGIGEISTFDGKNTSFRGRLDVITTALSVLHIEEDLANHEREPTPRCAGHVIGVKQVGRVYYALLRLDLNSSVNAGVRYSSVRITGNGLLQYENWKISSCQGKGYAEISLAIEGGCKQSKPLFESLMKGRNELSILFNQELPSAITIIPGLWDFVWRAADADDHSFRCFLHHVLRPRGMERTCVRKNKSLAMYHRDIEIITPEGLTRAGVNMDLDATQCSAVTQALKSEDCVFALIGPPGTGKTTTIALFVSLLTRCVIRNIKDLPAEEQAVHNIATQGAVLCETINAAQLATQKLLLAGVDVIFVPGRSMVTVSRMEVNAVNVYNLIPPELHPDVLFATYVDEYSTSNVKYADAIAKQGEAVRAEIRKHQVVVTNLAQAYENGSLFFLARKLHWVTIDEASQAHISAVLLVIWLMKDPRLILVGDTKQLGPLLLSPFAKALVTPPVSLMEVMLPYDHQISSNAVQLDIQRRQPIGCAELHSSVFYEKSVKSQAMANPLFENVGTRVFSHLFTHPDFGMGVVMCPLNTDFKSECEKGSFSRFNIGEANVVIMLVRMLLVYCSDVTQADVCVLTPYAAQARLIRIMIRETLDCATDVLVATVDAMQGREIPFVIMSMVHAEEGRKARPFVSEVRRLNVSLSRHQCMCILVTNGEAWNAGTQLAGHRAIAAYLAKADEIGNLCTPDDVHACVNSMEDVKRLRPCDALRQDSWCDEKLRCAHTQRTTLLHCLFVSIHTNKCTSDVIEIALT
jgi:hypothetical protein